MKYRVVEATVEIGGEVDIPIDAIVVEYCTGFDMVDNGGKVPGLRTVHRITYLHPIHSE